MRPWKLNIEIKLFLILIPLINVFNYYLTYTGIPFNGHTILTFTIDTLIGYAAWATVHVIIIRLDKSFPCTGNILKRITVQIIATLFSGMLIIISLTLVIHYIFKKGPLPSSFFTNDVFIISVWFLVVNGIYVALHFYRQWHQAERMRLEENKVKAGGLNVKSGKQELILSFEEIAGLAVDGEYIICHTMAGKKFLLDQSMDKLESLLPSTWFFRLNRQCLVHRQVISAYEKIENGKLNILLKPAIAIPSPIKVSRTRAAGFKNWFQIA